MRKNIFLILLIIVMTFSLSGCSEQTSQSVTVNTAPEKIQLNINTCSTAALMAVPGLGESKAAYIVDEIENNGPFKDGRAMEERLAPYNIGPKVMARIDKTFTYGR